jgi:signal transduction histidine kinase
VLASLDVACGSQRAAAVTAPITLESTAAPQGARILIVDDDARIRRAVCTAMERIGLHVFSAEDSVSAIKLAEQTPPDLALVDFNMATPGIQVVRRLKELHGAAVWVAILSGQDDEATRAQCFDAGADDVIGKPVPMAELRRRMIAVARMQQAHVETRLARERADRLMAYGAEASAMLAHDLNNGLAVALMNMRFLQEAAAQLGPDHSAALAATIRAIERMSGLVGNLVDIGRFEDAAVKPALERVKVRDLVCEVLAVHAGSGDRKLTHVIDVPDDLDGTFDAALIERVLHNLIGNAVRYCPDGGELRVRARRWDEAGIELDVLNDGPPIDPAIRERLFTKYAKGKNGKRGFGLYFCRLACEAHGGTIEYGIHDERSCFRIRLPGH